MNSIRSINIYVIQRDQTLEYTALELKKYLEKMCSGLNIDIIKKNEYEGNLKDGLWLGLFSDFGYNNLIDSKATEFDDYVKISVQNCKGIISGVNSRSVLIGMYSFLKNCGCRFIRPGADGEYIPNTSCDLLSAEYEHRPSYTHRGVCIEGAVSYENVFDIIEWSPKVGFNSYFIQFREAYTFFERWYNHRNNSQKKPEGFSIERARDIVAKLENEIKKRGLIYHAVGHGWTCEPLNIPGLDWDEPFLSVPEEVKGYLALVDGKRELWGGIPLNTNLCYSNETVQSLIVEGIVEYLKIHTNIDVLHFWLADGTNNQCECENCRDTRPSDFYIRMLNKLDKRLTKEGIKTKIVFLIYVDLFWPPEKEKLENTERFIMMFAPFDRVYNKSFVTNEEKAAISPYRRNNIDRPSSIPENLAYLYAWQDMFKGDSFDFDYHYMWAHLFDPGYFNISRVLYEDIKNLKNIGLNGYISCQLQRTFIPTGLGMYVMSRTLWDDTSSFDEIANEYFYGAFGETGVKCSEYLDGLSRMFYPTFINDKIEDIDLKEAERFSSILEYINEFVPFIDRNLNSGVTCYDLSYKYLKYHSRIASLFAEILKARTEKDMDKVHETWAILRNMLEKEEDSIQSGIDIFQYIETMKALFE